MHFKRLLSTTTPSSVGPVFRVGLIPGDGIGKEVVGVSFLFLIQLFNLKATKSVIQSLPNAKKYMFIDLIAGFEAFQVSGAALPQQTIDALTNHCNGAIFGAVRYSFIFII
jgi:homoisocitrate dehydrogenase